MRIIKFSDKVEWEVFRRGKITGSRLKDVLVKRGTEMKKGYYELIAERLATEPDGENVMDRGHRLEPEALQLFIQEMADEGVPTEEWETGLVCWQRDENDFIAISPDGYHVDLEEAIEVKCLNSADHIKAYLTQDIPSLYEDQVMQYFVVNDKLRKLHFVMYDPRLTVASYFVLVIERDDKKVADYLAKEYNLMASVEAQVAKLTANLF